jgi:hypothetical protein
MPSYTRTPFGSEHPELTTGNGFPRFNSSNSDAIVPGVDNKITLIP